MFPSSPMYLRSYLAASVSKGSLSAVSSMANTAFCLNSALSSKLILASKQTTVDRQQKSVGTYCHILYFNALLCQTHTEVYREIYTNSIKKAKLNFKVYRSFCVIPKTAVHKQIEQTFSLISLIL